MSDQRITDDDIPDSDPNDPGRYTRAGRDYVGEQEDEEMREDHIWTVYALLGVLLLVIIALLVLAFLA